MTNTVIVVSGMLILLGVCGLAVWKGGPPERRSAIWVLGTWLVVVAASFLLPRDTTYLLVLSLDGVLATALLFISIQYASLWLGGAMLVQSSAFALHAWYLTTEPENHDTYVMAINLLSYAVLLLLLVATLNRWSGRARRRGRHGREANAFGRASRRRLTFNPLCRIGTALRRSPNDTSTATTPAPI